MKQMKESIQNTWLRRTSTTVNAVHTIHAPLERAHGRNFALCVFCLVVANILILFLVIQKVCYKSYQNIDLYIPTCSLCSNESNGI